MSQFAEQLAQAILEKARNVEVGFCHTPSVNESFFTMFVRKYLARILRPLTSLVTEAGELQQAILASQADLKGNIRDLGTLLAAEQSRLSHVQGELADSLQRAQTIQRDVSELKTAVQSVRGKPADNLSDSSQEAYWDEFYKRFEDRFRGDPTSIMERLTVRYRTKLSELCAVLPDSESAVSPPVLIDLGCGRGEFLNLARDVGFKTIGIDILAAMVRETALQGHETHLGDLYFYLKTCPASSVDALTMFHVIEHCPAKYVLKIFREAARVLKPGGVFIVETPSVFSLWVTARQFYLDPTHTHPVHPDYVAFVAQDSGFSKSECFEFEPVFHSERASMTSVASGNLTTEFAKLENWLYGPQDICIWATR